MHFLFRLLAASSIFLAAGAVQARDTRTPTAATDAKVSACFAPAENCTPAIVAAIAAAKSSIRVQAYGFTSPAILKALIDAKNANVDVEIILDKSNERARYTGATTMTNAGIPVRIDTTVAIAHNKVIIIDDHLVIGGSFNYTTSADRRNAENVTFIDSATVAGWFSANWQARNAVSTNYTAPAG